jgi:hypothetical protein
VVGKEAEAAKFALHFSVSRKFRVSDLLASICAGQPVNIVLDTEFPG